MRRARTRVSLSAMSNITRLSALILLAAGACADVQSIPAGDGLYDVTYEHPTDGGAGAEQHMTNEAGALCPDGYTIERRQVQPREGRSDLYIWRVRCLN